MENLGVFRKRDTQFFVISVSIMAGVLVKEMHMKDVSFLFVM